MDIDLAKVKGSTLLSPQTTAQGTNQGNKPDLMPFLVGLLALGALVPGLGSYKMLDPTDSFFVETGREMLVSHHYLTPLFNYADWLDKPAFPFLLIVLSYKLFGVSAWAARLPSALSAIALAVCTYSSTARLLGRRTAVLASIILVSTPLFSAVGHLALSDEPLALFIGVAILGFAEALVSDRSRSMIVPYFGLALAMLCKGPLGLVLSVGVLATYLIVTSRTSVQILSKCRRLRPLTGLAILLIACFPYYVVAHIGTDGAFTREFFFHQNLGRFEGTVNHQQPFWWYIPVSLGGFFPWTLFVLGGAPWFRSLWNERHNQDAARSFLLFCLVWSCFAFLFFSAIPTKLPTYILPLSPAIAIMTAAYLNNLLESDNRRLLFLYCGLIFAIAALALIAISCSSLASLILTPAITAAAATVVAIMILPLVLSKLGRPSASVWTLVLSSYMACSLLVPLSFQQFYETHQVPLDKLIKLSKAKGATLGILFSTVPSACFVYEKRIETLNSLDEVKDFSEKGPAPHYLLATHNCLTIPQLKATERIVDQAGKWYLLSVDGYSGRSP